MTDETTEDVLITAARWDAEGRRVALATVIETWGSSPCPVGSQMVVSEDQAFLGSVSGGCVEGAVIEQALNTIKDGEPRLLSFGVSDETAWDIGLACGGRIRVYIEAVGD